MLFGASLMAFTTLSGQLVLIVGEPGLGKSRLIEEFHAGKFVTSHTGLTQGHVVGPNPGRFPPKPDP
jgi:hypothetical protein